MTMDEKTCIINVNSPQIAKEYCAVVINTGWN